MAGNNLDRKIRRRAEIIRSRKAYKTENRLRVALYYSIELLADVLIIFLFIKAFSVSFNFAHEVFYDASKNPRDKSYVNVVIPPDSGTTDIAGILYDNGVIKNKYVMIAKIKVGEIGGKIKPGKYKLSPSMKYSEIIGIITGGITTNEEPEKPATIISTPTDAEEIHDNSEMGAGGGAEGDDYVPEDGGDATDDFGGVDGGGESGPSEE